MVDGVDLVWHVDGDVFAEEEGEGWLVKYYQDLSWLRVDRKGQRRTDKKSILMILPPEDKL